MISKKIFEKTIEYFLRPIQCLLKDDSISEVMINNYKTIWYEQGGKLLQAEDLTFNNEEALLAAVTNIAQYAGHHLRPETARFDASLPQGHRVHVVFHPVSRMGLSVTIRKHSKGSLRLEELISKHKSLTIEARDFLAQCVEGEQNIIVSGGTGTGKTTLLNALSSLIPPGERILTLEDAAELQLSQPHVVSLQVRPPNRRGEGGVTIRDLLHSSLRMRPDRIIVGECRGGEALDLLQALNTGHGGSMSTVHANTPKGALERLDTLALFAGEEIPVKFLRAQVAAAIQVIVQLARYEGRRIVRSIATNSSRLNKGDGYQITEVFVFDEKRKALVRKDPSRQVDA